MDELKISSKFMRGIVSKVVSKLLYKKLGYKIDIQLNDLQVRVVDGTANVHIDADAKMNESELKKVTKIIEEK